MPYVVALAKRIGKYTKSTARMQAQVHSMTRPRNQLMKLHTQACSSCWVGGYLCTCKHACLKLQRTSYALKTSYSARYWVVDQQAARQSAVSC